MITSINEKNRGRYAELFAEASNLLVEEQVLGPSYTSVDVAPDTYYPNYYYILDGEEYVLDNSDEFDATKQYYVVTSSINTLEEYFANIGSLYHATEGDPRYKYIMLPLDEEPFEINANTREITVPASFKKNGIAVQGDNMAEMLFFRIDRYFDAQDLGNPETMLIYIQWEDVDKNQYVTPISMIDIDSEPGKVIFAWPIASKLTAKSGTIKFSVRFIQTSGADKIDYSLSTLPATVNVNAGLNYDIFNVESDETASDLFQYIITNSAATAGPVPAEVVFSIAEDVYIVMDAVDGSATNFKTEDIQLTSYVSDLTNAGSLTYNWFYKSDEENSRRVYLGAENVGKAELVNFMPKSIFKNCDGQTYDANKNYYQANDDITAYEVVIIDEDTFNASPSSYYERYTGVQITGAIGDKVTGKYFVEAVNRPSVRTKTSYSDEFILEPPKAPSIKGTPAAVVSLDTNGQAVLIFTFETDKEAVNTYQLYHKGVNATDFTAYGNSNSDTVTDIGYYYVAIDSVKNLAKASVDSKGQDQDNPIYIKVVGQPEVPVLSEDQAYIDDNTVITVSEKQNFTIKLDESFENKIKNELYSDGVQYIWMAKEATDTNEDGELNYVEYAQGATIEINKNTATPLYCRVINTLNGVTAESRSRLIINTIS